jgi:hypothetical protein
MITIMNIVDVRGVTGPHHTSEISGTRKEESR